MAIALSQVTTNTTTGDKTINVPSGLTNVTILYIHVINDSDSAHTTVDGNFTFGGNTMTAAFTQVRNSPYVIDCYYLKNFTGSGNQTMHVGNHGGFGTIGSAVYIFSGSDTASQPDATATGTGSTANPSTTITTATANSYIVEAIGGANSLTANASQTVDLSSDTNIRIGSKQATTATGYAEAWTMSAGVWAHGLVAIKEAAGGGGVTVKRLAALGVG